jgi:chromosome segregation ATPase
MSKIKEALELKLSKNESTAKIEATLNRLAREWHEPISQATQRVSSLKHEFKTLKAEFDSIESEKQEAYQSFDVTVDQLIGFIKKKAAVRRRLISKQKEIAQAQEELDLFERERTDSVGNVEESVEDSFVIPEL